MHRPNKPNAFKSIVYYYHTVFYNKDGSKVTKRLFEGHVLSQSQSHTHICLLDKDYNGDGSESSHVEIQNLGGIRLSVIEAVSLSCICDARVDNVDAWSVAVFIQAHGKPKEKGRTWILVCTEEERAKALL